MRGLPFGIPGIGEDMDGAMQHAPQPTRQSICISPSDLRVSVVQFPLSGFGVSLAHLYNYRSSKIFCCSRSIFHD